MPSESDVYAPVSAPSNETWSESVTETWSAGQIAEACGYESATFANTARASGSVSESLVDYCLCLHGAESESENVACLYCAGEIARGVVLAHVGHVVQANDFEVGENDRIVASPS
jgi:hypothetical protein